MKQGLRTAGREVAMTAGVRTAGAAASPGPAGGRGIVAGVSRP